MSSGDEWDRKTRLSMASCSQSSSSFLNWKKIKIKVIYIRHAWEIFFMYKLIINLIHTHTHMMQHGIFCCMQIKMLWSSPPYLQCDRYCKLYNYLELNRIITTIQVVLLKILNILFHRNFILTELIVSCKSSPHSNSPIS